MRVTVLKYKCSLEGRTPLLPFFSDYCMPEMFYPHNNTRTGHNYNSYFLDETEGQCCACYWEMSLVPLSPNASGLPQRILLPNSSSSNPRTGCLVLWWTSLRLAVVWGGCDESLCLQGDDGHPGYGSIGSKGAKVSKACQQQAGHFPCIFCCVVFICLPHLLYLWEKRKRARQFGTCRDFDNLFADILWGMEWK